MGHTPSQRSLAAFQDLVEVPKTDLAECRIWEPTSVSIPAGVGDVRKALDIVPQGAPVAAEAPSRLRMGLTEG